MKKLFIVTVFLFSAFSLFLFSSNSSKVNAANVTVNAPTSSTNYSQIPFNINQTAPILAESMTMTFTPVPYGTALTYTIDPVSNPFVTTFNPRSMFSNVNVLSGTASIIPDNYYNVTISWRRASDNVLESVGLSAVIIDTTTLPGIIDEPQTGGSYTTVMPISVYLPDPASPGSVRVVFHNNSTNVDTTLNLVDSPPGSLFNVNPRSLSVGYPITAISAPSLGAGNYNMTLIYQDDLGNPASSVIESNFTIVGAPVPPPVAPPTSPTPTPPGATPPTTSPTQTPSTNPSEVPPTEINTNGVITSEPIYNEDGTPVTNAVVSKPRASASSLLVLVALCCGAAIVLLILLGYLAYQNPNLRAWLTSLKAKFK